MQAPIQHTAMVAPALEVLAAIKSSGALEGLLGIQRRSDYKSDREAAAISLVVHFKSPSVSLSRVRRGLDAIAELERVSHSLNGYPLAKRVFWCRILEQPGPLLVAGHELGHTYAPWYEDPAFPQLVLEFSSEAVTPDLVRIVADWQRANARCVGSFGDYLVSRGEARNRRVVPVTLKLQGCGDDEDAVCLTVDAIKSLKLLLDPFGASSTSEVDAAAAPCFRLASLDLTGNSLDDERVDALARVVRAADPPLEALVLDHAIKGSDERDLAAFRTLIRTVTGLSSGLDSRNCGVCHLSLARNPLSCDHIAAVCSAALDPACTLEELCLAQSVGSDWSSCDSGNFAW